MKRCLLGCGNIIHNIDEHVTFMHPDKKDEFPDRMEYPAGPRDEDKYDEWADTEDARDRFIEDNFEGVTLA